MIQSLSLRLNIEKRSVQGRRLMNKIILTEAKLPSTSTIKRENRGPVWEKPVPDL